MIKNINLEYYIICRYKTIYSIIIPIYLLYVPLNVNKALKKSDTNYYQCTILVIHRSPQIRSKICEKVNNLFVTPEFFVLFTSLNLHKNLSTTKSSNTFVILSGTDPLPNLDKDNNND